jgi:hypothetical protein
MVPDTLDHQRAAVGPGDPPCTARCLARCARAALRAGEEGSGLALPLPGAEPRCRFHQELLHAARYRRLRTLVVATLQSVRHWRPAQVLYRYRAKRAAIASAAAASGLRPRCTPVCLARCVRTGLTAGPRGSGLGLAGGGYCRLHQAVLASEHGVARRAIARTFGLVRLSRSAARAVIAPWRAPVMRGAAVAARIRSFEARLRQPSGAERGRHEIIVALVRARAARATMSLRVLAARLIASLRSQVARMHPHVWGPPLRRRARARGEVQLRRTIDAVTEFLIWAMPPPKPPIRSVVHVSLISHKQYMLSRLARNHGLKGTFLAINTYPNAHLKIGFDYEVPMNMDPFRRYLRASWYLWRVLALHDVIHYHFNGFLFDDGTDLRVLQRMGKVVVVHYRGCDLRCRSINMAKNPGLNVCQECSYPPGSCDTDYQRNKIAISRTHSDIRFVTTPDLLDFTDDAEHLPFIAPYAIDFSAIAPAPRTPGVFRVVTSSNHPALDGVRFVRDAVDRLAAEGVKIELIEIYRQAFAEALALYKSADLYCGKLRMGYYNNANIESLMLGVPNMCYIRDEYLDRIPDSPIIVARPEDVYQKLREWVGKPDELKRLGSRGPEFVRRHHHADELMVRMIARYNEALERKVAARCEATLPSSVVH